MPLTEPRRTLPSVDRLLRAPELADALEVHGRARILATVREVLEAHRARARADAPGAPAAGSQTRGVAAAPEGLCAEVLARLPSPPAVGLRPVFNLTGVVLHTNLGRALLSEAAARRAAEAMVRPCTLEYDLDSGGRGDRDAGVERLLTELTGAEAALVVNNNAAAVLLVLTALARGREVVVSRGELVEIGGSFRIPEVMTAAGARLREVGATNRTHPQDYRDAVGPRTALLMKVHPSNYRISGFAASTSEREVAAVAHAAGLPLAVDLGAGSLVDLRRWGLPREPTPAESLTAGADLVTFSGDKLLGGPQAGLVVGRGDLVRRLARHPLKRALRVSKPVLAALEATLEAYRRPDALAREIPTLRLLARPLAEVRALAERLAPALAEALGAAWRVEAAATRGQVGSGSMPEDVLDSAGLAVSSSPRRSGRRAMELAARLRRLPIPVIGRIERDRVILDVRCLEDEAGFRRQLPLLRSME